LTVARPPRLPPEKLEGYKRVIRYLATIEEADAAAMFYALTLRPALRTHPMKKRLRDFREGLRWAFLGGPE